MNRFYKDGMLRDTEIALALVNAATEYENGELLEVRDTLADIVSAIDMFSDKEDRNGSK